MQTCYNCGKQVDDNVLICPDCGALVRRYGKPAPQQEEPVADLTYAPEAAEARPAKPKRFQTGAKVWLILCIIAAAFQTISFFNLFYLYGNQEWFNDVFAAYPELSPMRDLLDMMMQSVSVYLWFYILEASLLLLKCAGLIWFAASARRTAFLATAIVAGLLPLPRLIQPPIQIPQRRRKRRPACRRQRLIRQLAELVLVICQIRHRTAQPRHRRCLAQTRNAARCNRPVINLRLCKYL